MFGHMIYKEYSSKDSSHDDDKFVGNVINVINVGNSDNELNRYF